MMSCRKMVITNQSGKGKCDDEKRHREKNSRKGAGHERNISDLRKNEMGKKPPNDRGFLQCEQSVPITGRSDKSSHGSENAANCHNIIRQMHRHCLVHVCDGLRL